MPAQKAQGKMRQSPNRVTVQKSKAVAQDGIKELNTGMCKVQRLLPVLGSSQKWQVLYKTFKDLPPA